jgi:Ca2+-binding EF-hand superfamily protein
MEKRLLIMQLLKRAKPDEALFKEADVNGDGKISMEEVIYILQKKAGLR